MKKITQKNVRLLLPGKVAKAATLLAQEKNISPKEALVLFYRSGVYKNLEVESSKYWWLSGEQLFEDFLRD